MTFLCTIVNGLLCLHYFVSQNIIAHFAIPIHCLLRNIKKYYEAGVLLFAVNQIVLKILFYIAITFDDLEFCFYAATFKEGNNS